MTPPTGTVTFLFTDIQGSTKLWEEHRVAMGIALAHHDAVLRSAIERNHGYVFKTIGDAFCAAFSTAADALNAALTAQQALASEISSDGLSLRVRMAVHTGAVEFRDDDYFGQPLNRVARLLATGHGGQVLLSDVARDLAFDFLSPPASLKSLGEHRLRDLGRPEHVYQLVHPDLPLDFPPLESLDNPALPNNLPIQVTSFIGREKEIEAVQSLLGKTRLLTLTGGGGAGKTRLSLQVATDVLDHYPDGVWFTELAPLADPGLVPQALANALGIREEGGKPILQTVVDFLNTKHVLLVLDNCEHVLNACARLADTLVRNCPHVQMLASSREALGIAGEQTYRIPSLSLPDVRQAQTVESVSHYEAVRLFIERALAVDTQFKITNADAPALAELCVRLDGIPLAIELAAARVRSLSVEEINKRLDDRFRLLTGGSRTALPRQQTLRALIDWSYDLLTDGEKALFCRLSVFAGGCVIEAAEVVGVGDEVEDWEVLDLLTSLVDKSLVVAEQEHGQTRYRLLETIRQYAGGRLQESGGSALMCERHQDYFLAFAEEAAPKLTGPDQAEWLQRLDTEHENLRAVLAKSLEEATASVALRLCGALQQFWWMRGHLSEGREWCVRALGKTGDAERTRQRAKALNGAGNLAFDQGEYPAARAYYEESLLFYQETGNMPGIAATVSNLGNVAYAQGDYISAGAYHEQSLGIKRETNDRRGIAISLNNLGNVAYVQGVYPAARAYYEESLLIAREIEDRSAIAAALSNLGSVAHEQGRYVSARAHHEESLYIQRQTGNRSGIASSLTNLGNVAYEQGDDPTSRAYHSESLSIQREIGDRNGIAKSLESFAALDLKQGRSERATALLGAAERLREEIGAPLPPNERDACDRQVVVARAALGEAAFAKAWDEGRAMKMEQAIEYALEESTNA